MLTAERGNEVKGYNTLMNSVLRPLVYKADRGAWERGELVFPA